MGLTFSSEQNRRTGVRHVVAIIVTDNFAGIWNEPHVFIQGQSTAPASAFASGSTVTPGMRLRITSPAGDSGAPKYFYTLDGTDPHPNNPSAMAFNFNSNQPSDTTNPPIIVPEPAQGQRQFIIKAATFGDGRLESGIVTFAYNYPFAGNTAFLTGPDEVNIDEANDIEYTVNIANVTDINMITLRVSYDTDKLTFDDITLSLPVNLSAWVLGRNNNVAEGIIDFTIAGGALGQVFTSENAAEVASLKFTLKDGLAEKDVIETELISGTVINPITGIRQSAVIADAKVSTTIMVDEEDPLLKYDINGDGVFDLLDLAIVIYRYFMVANGEALWAEASVFDRMNRGVIDTANIIALYSLIA
jgi:hypothetical protein